MADGKWKMAIELFERLPSSGQSFIYPFYSWHGVQWSRRSSEPRSTKCQWRKNFAWSCRNARASACAAIVFIQGQMCRCEDNHKKCLSSFDDIIFKVNINRRMRTNEFVWGHKLCKRVPSVVWVLFVDIPRRTKKTHTTSGFWLHRLHVNEMKSFLLTEKNKRPCMRQRFLQRSTIQAI